jgi:4-oxalocrotonate tautomerase
MPMIKVEMFEGRTYEQKKMLAKLLTEAFTTATGARPDSVQVIFSEVAKSDWSVAGELCSENNPWAAPASSSETSL